MQVDEMELHSCSMLLDLKITGRYGYDIVSFYLQLMVILGLVNDGGSSYLSQLCMLAPVQVR